MNSKVVPTEFSFARQQVLDLRDTLLTKLPREIGRLTTILEVGCKLVAMLEAPQEHPMLRIPTSLHTCINLAGRLALSLAALRKRLRSRCFFLRCRDETFVSHLSLLSTVCSTSLDRSTWRSLESKDEVLPAEHQGTDGVPQGERREETHQGMRIPYSTHLRHGPVKYFNARSITGFSGFIVHHHEIS